MNAKMALIIGIAAMAGGGCKTAPPNLLRSIVGSSVGYELIEHPDAAPAVSVAAQTVCTLAAGTNVSPATIVNALNGRIPPKDVLLIKMGVNLYSAAYAQLPSTNAAASSALAAELCDGLNDSLLFVPGWPATLTGVPQPLKRGRQPPPPARRFPPPLDPRFPQVQ